MRINGGEVDSIYFISILDNMSSVEMREMLLSNLFDKETKDWIKNIKLPQRQIEEIIPAIGLIAVASMIMELVSK